MDMRFVPEAFEKQDLMSDRLTRKPEQDGQEKTRIIE